MTYYSYFQFPYSSLNWFTKRAHTIEFMFFFIIRQSTDYDFLHERLRSEPFLKLTTNVLLIIFWRYLFVQMREIIAD